MNNLSPANDEYFNAFFYAIVRGVWSSGGDGEGTLAVQHWNYKEVAEKFQEFEVKLYDGRLKKMKELWTIEHRNDCILFYSRQESISIRQFEQGMTKGEYEDVFIVC